LIKNKRRKVSESTDLAINLVLPSRKATRKPPGLKPASAD
jgi:hypothetical protein